MKFRRNLLKFLLAGVVPAFGQRNSGGARILKRQPLPPPFDGMEATFVEVTIPAGPGSPAHRHPGFVLGYVLEGEFRFGTSEQAERVLKPGDVFYEPPDAVHTMSASAHPDRAARILAIIVGEKGKPTAISQH